ncbi:hypothetical protein CLV91_1497 [Maribacter vaceletii]|uniref:Uncharacterized protein n=1 Tax=Maribacter vaceletii TaxID=1206816 RepID=A0A495EFH5_9FLAO|nr:hypothetical protein [Maribacter vaceletii]RKR15411.1 hypothetical protein CLV91_1497 [Maribacter vaceletii]
MKVFTTLSTLLLLSLCTPIFAQTTPSQDSTKQANLLDEQVKMYGSVFSLGGATEEENPVKGATNYLDLLDKLNLSPELKKQVEEIYQLYDTSLDPLKKEELKIRANKMIQDAMAKSASEN